MLNETEDLLTKLDDNIRRLKIQYDLFFAGVRKLPPTEDRKRIDEQMREMHRGAKLRDNASRFRFATIVQKYNQFQELWSRQMREREEGPTDFRKRQAALQAKGGTTPPPKQAEPKREVETSAAADSYIKVTSGGEGDAMKELHRQIAEANRKLGKAAAPSIEQITAMVQKQAEELRNRYRVETVAFRVELVDGKVKLKARPVAK